MKKRWMVSLVYIIVLAALIGFGVTFLKEGVLPTKRGYYTLRHFLDMKTLIFLR